MATGIEATILDALCEHLSSLTLSPALSIAWPNVDFEPDEDGYLRATQLRNTATQISLGNSGKNRHSGIFQVDVFAKQGIGEESPVETASLIAAHFKRGTDITAGSYTVRVNFPPVVGSSVRSDPYLMVPVSIRYIVDTDNP